MAQELSAKGFFSILRWRTDPTRDEARNVAILLVDEASQLSAFRSAPLSSISPRLHEQGLLDEVLVNLEKRLTSSRSPKVDMLNQMSASLADSIYLTPPQSVALSDPDSVLGALYRAYVAPRSAPRSLTKGVVLDKTVAVLRRHGWEVKRGQYVKDYIFDLVLKGDRHGVGEVLSFATGAKTWTNVEKDAGHFLYGISRLQSAGFEVGEPFAVIQPPAKGAHSEAVKSLRRINGWMKDSQVEVLTPDELEDFAKDQQSLNL